MKTITKERAMTLYETDKVIQSNLEKISNMKINTETYLHTGDKFFELYKQAIDLRYDVKLFSIQVGSFKQKCGYSVIDIINLQNETNWTEQEVEEKFREFYKKCEIQKIIPHIKRLREVYDSGAVYAWPSTKEFLDNGTKWN